MINHDESTPTQRGGICSLSATLGTAAAAGSLGPPGLAGVLGGRGIITGAPSPHQLSRQGSSVESHASSVPIHFHTAECSATGRTLHQPTHHSKVSNNIFLCTCVYIHINVCKFRFLYSIFYDFFPYLNNSVAPQHLTSVTSTVAPYMRVI